MTRENLKNNIIAFDVSLRRTGYAVVNDIGLLHYGFFTLPAKYNKMTFKDEEFPQALLFYKKIVYNIMCEWIVDSATNWVVFEDLNARYVNTVKVLMQVQAAAKIGVAEAWSDARVALVNNKTVKSVMGVPTRSIQFSKAILATAKKEKKKPVKIVMVDNVNDIFGTDLTYEQDDEADAVGLAWVKLNQIQDQGAEES